MKPPNYKSKNARSKHASHLSEGHQPFPDERLNLYHMDRHTEIVDTNYNGVTPMSTCASASENSHDQGTRK